jgi:hypothetical protein
LSQSKIYNLRLQDEETSISINEKYSSSEPIIEVENIYKNIKFSLKKNQCLGIISCGINLDFKSLIQYLTLIKSNPLNSKLKISNKIKIGF